jgi:hypothetical protein
MGRGGGPDGCLVWWELGPPHQPITTLTHLYHPPYLSHTSHTPRYIQVHGTLIISPTQHPPPPPGPLPLLCTRTWAKQEKPVTEASSPLLHLPHPLLHSRSSPPQEKANESSTHSTSEQESITPTWCVCSVVLLLLCTRKSELRLLSPIVFAYSPARLSSIFKRPDIFRPFIQRS